MKNYTLFFIFFNFYFNFAQIKGTVTDSAGNPLPFVSIFEEDTYNATTSNDQGIYELNIKTAGTHSVVFSIFRL
jgi:hypothetical protein